MRAPDIRTVVRDQIASFDDLRIVEGVFHVVVQVFAAHGARVSQSLKCVAAEGLLYLQNRDRKRSRRLRRLRRRRADRNRTNESKGFL